MEKDKVRGLDKSLKLLAKTSFVVFMGVILSKLFTYAYKIIVARGFGPEEYGLFSLATMISSLFIAFASFGLIEGLTRYIPLYNGKRKYDRARYIFRTAFYALIITSIAFGVILFFLAEAISLRIFHNEGLIIYLQIFGLLVPISVMSSLYLAALRASEKIGPYSFIVNIFQSFAKLAMLLIFIFLGIKLNAVPISYLIGTLLMLFAAYFVSKYYVSGIFKKAKIESFERSETIRELFRYSWPIMFLSLISVLFYWIDSFVIGYFNNAAAVGFYNAAFSIIALFGIAPELFMQLFFPLIVREYARKNLILIEETSKQVTKWIFLLNLPLFTIVFLFPGAIINILFGSQYLVAESALRILSIGGFLSSTMALGNNILSMEGKSKMILSNILIASLINLVLNILLVPRYGLIGAAFATSLVWILLSATVFIEVKKYTSIVPLRRKMLRILLVSLIPTVLLIIAKQYISINLPNMILLGVLFMFVYLFLMVLTRCFDKNDIMIFRSIKHKLNFKA